MKDNEELKVKDAIPTLHRMVCDHIIFKRHGRVVVGDDVKEDDLINGITFEDDEGTTYVVVHLAW